MQVNVAYSSRLESGCMSMRVDFECEKCALFYSITFYIVGQGKDTLFHLHNRIRCEGLQSIFKPNGNCFCIKFSYWKTTS